MAPPVVLSDASIAPPPAPSSSEGVRLWLGAVPTVAGDWGLGGTPSHCNFV